LYHLIADYYSKSKDKDLDKVCNYYLMDLCVCPDRADSWAGLALASAAIAEQMLENVSYTRNLHIFYVTCVL